MTTDEILTLTMRLEEVTEAMTVQMAELDDDHLRYTGWNPFAWLHDKITDATRNSSARQAFNTLSEEAIKLRAELRRELWPAMKSEIKGWPNQVSTNMEKTLRALSLAETKQNSADLLLGEIDDCIHLCEAARGSEVFDSYAQGMFTAMDSAKSTKKAQDALEKLALKYPESKIPEAVNLRPRGDLRDIMNPASGILSSVSNADIFQKQVEALQALRPVFVEAARSAASERDAQEQKSMTEFSATMRRQNPNASTIYMRAATALRLELEALPPKYAP